MGLHLWTNAVARGMTTTSSLRWRSSGMLAFASLVPEVMRILPVAGVASSQDRILGDVGILGNAHCPQYPGTLSLAAGPTITSALSAFTVQMAAASTGAYSILNDWIDFLRPRKRAMRLDVKMKRAAAPYPRNPGRRKPIPKVKGILRKLLDD